MLAAPGLLDDPADPDVTRPFLAEPTHHLFFALDSVGRPVGFVSGVETTHRTRAPRCMWVLTDDDNVAARRTDERAGAQGSSSHLMLELPRQR